VEADQNLGEGPRELLGRSGFSAPTRRAAQTLIVPDGHGAHWSACRHASRRAQDTEIGIVQQQHEIPQLA